MSPRIKTTRFGFERESRARTCRSPRAAGRNDSVIHEAEGLGGSASAHPLKKASAADLAAKTGSNPPALYRLLRALASVGVYREQSDGRFTNTAASEELRSDIENSRRAMAMMMGEERLVSR